MIDELVGSPSMNAAMPWPYWPVADLAGAGVRAVERVRAASRAQIGFLLAKAAPVVTELHRVPAGRLRERRGKLHVVERLRAAVVEAALLRPERGHAAGGRRVAGLDAEARELFEVAQQPEGRARVAEARQVEVVKREEIVVESQPAAFQVEHHARRNHGRVAACPVVIEAVCRAARDFHAIHLAREVEAFLAPEITEEPAIGAL